MAWTNIVNGELASSVRSKINALGALVDTKADKRTSQVLKTASYILALSDAFTKQKCLSASTINITIPTNATVNFAINDEIVIIQYGAGAVTVTPASGVTLNGGTSVISLNSIYKAATLTQIATNEWLLVGSLI